MLPRTRAKMVEETRAKLLTAARKAFAKYGYAAASMDDMTADAGLTRGALYHNEVISRLYRVYMPDRPPILTQTGVEALGLPTMRIEIRVTAILG